MSAILDVVDIVDCLLGEVWRDSRDMLPEVVAG